MDKFRIDSHKLMYHPRRVSQWLDGMDISPIYIEVSPSGSCNHRCTYCALDYMGYVPRYLLRQRLKDRISEMAGLGVKSIMYAGEGEPLLHPALAEIIQHTEGYGIDVAVTSNGVFLNKKFVESALPSITWIKISFNAGTKETYARIHGTREGDFDRVLQNISHAVKERDRLKLKTTIGMQMVLLPENMDADESLRLARQAEDIGVDYLVIKPYSQHSKSLTTKYKDFRYGNYYYLSNALEKLSDEHFKIIFRMNTIKKLENKERTYARCLALPFWSYIDAEGGVWGCSAYLGDSRFLLGNINESRFIEIWNGQKRKNMMAFVSKELDTKECRKNCRMDEVNRYLWELKNPSPHVNFI